VGAGTAGTLVLGRSKSVKEVAGIIGIAEATVKTRMFYARKKLAALVATAELVCRYSRTVRTSRIFICAVESL
jgi:DNA-binding NarL/FixJ family response regulator